MTLHVGKGNLQYTRADIMEAAHQSAFCEAKQQAARLVEVQKKTLPLMPAAQGQLHPGDELTGRQVQMNLLYFIFLRSLFAFAGKAWDLLEDTCIRLAEAENRQDEFETANLKMDLNELTVGLEKIPLENLADDCTCGLMRLNDFKEFLQRPRLDFPVCGKMTFNDIIGIIRNQGLTSTVLLDSMLSEACPDVISTGKLLADGTAIRMN